MSSMFSRIAGVARSAAERVHGEAVMLYAMERAGGPNGAPALSPTRMSYSTMALFFEDSQVLTSVAQPVLSRSDRRPLAHFSPPLVASLRLVDDRIRTGDRLERAGRWYEITEIRPDGLGGAMLTLAVSKPLTV